MLLLNISNAILLFVAISLFLTAKQVTLFDTTVVLLSPTTFWLLLLCIMGSVIGTVIANRRHPTEKAPAPGQEPKEKPKRDSMTDEEHQKYLRDRQIGDW